MKISFDEIVGVLEVNSRGLWTLSIPSKGMFITERSVSTNDHDLIIAQEKIMNRAKSLLWTFPLKEF